MKMVKWCGKLCVNIRGWILINYWNSRNILCAVVVTRIVFLHDKILFMLITAKNRKKNISYFEIYLMLNSPVDWTHRRHFYEFFSTKLLHQFSNWLQYLFAERSPTELQRSPTLHKQHLFVLGGSFEERKMSRFPFRWALSWNNPLWKWSCWNHLAVIEIHEFRQSCKDFHLIQMPSCA